MDILSVSRFKVSKFFEFLMFRYVKYYNLVALFGAFVKIMQEDLLALMPKVRWQVSTFFNAKIVSIDKQIQKPI